MKLCCISDTHGVRYELPDADVLIHAGDLTHYGSFKEVCEGFAWLSSFNKPVVCIAGNHDVCLENLLNNGAEAEFIRRLKSQNIHYLRDSACEINGVKFYGTPWVLQHSGIWDSADMHSVCQKIPSDVNVLVTHQPPHGILDGGMGCKELRSTLSTLPVLQLHIFGHVEAEYGITKLGNTVFCNAAQSTRRTDGSMRKPFVIEIPERASSARA